MYGGAAVATKIKATNQVNVLPKLQLLRIKSFERPDLRPDFYAALGKRARQFTEICVHGVAQSPRAGLPNMAYVASTKPCLGCLAHLRTNTILYAYHS